MIPTPFYLIDEARLLTNMRKVEALRAASGAKALLALKCFATWSAFDIMRPYMDGTTSSSLYELRLGREKFGKETHAYSVAWSDREIDEACSYADKIIFNTVGQLTRFEGPSAGIQRGVRLNPRFSTSGFDLADPARPFSRLGEWDVTKLLGVADLITGVMIHYNCENRDFALFDEQLGRIEREFAPLLEKLDWVSLGGGIHFTGEGYPLEELAKRLKTFSDRFGVQVYLEPGEASITQSTSLEVTVLDLLDNGKNLAIVDSSIEAHMLDLLIYRESAKLPQTGDHAYQICGKSCLAGDIFGEARFEQPLNVGDRISVADAAGYTMVKKNWFNGVNMPSIAIKRETGEIELIRQFGYEDYLTSLS
ncbi:carboxynorspermidine decarboxylase [Rhodobacter aestuarii]|uniref:Carboxynorspermidine/carboxyspermidine decarboxylase n=1 Tax=Rhodobacter aestuarii TaxID=453582 RepID=A0A1N7Q848_9RHOB|nr:MULTISPECIES: carboxynorspermidine decarboxylase [Rhodobacter]PTV93725.1 carboxynorspermidine decarboxylase [Rhodobacter aestuarii]SIT19023.1 carboxynorspermidine decarboxylase [Rhodobacter aestuarii]SOC08569.1 carboxynorspermidine decarboxylase [Rhodobacter sp. JA431]